MSDFKWRHCQSDVIHGYVRWYGFVALSAKTHTRIRGSDNIIYGKYTYATLTDEEALETSGNLIAA